MFEEVWESIPVKGYRDYIDNNYDVRYDSLSPNVYYKTFINVKTRKRVKVKNYVYKEFSSYTYDGIMKTFDRSKKEEIRGEINYILKLVKTTINE